MTTSWNVTYGDNYCSKASCKESKTPETRIQTILLVTTTNNLNEAGILFLILLVRINDGNYILKVPLGQIRYQYGVVEVNPLANPYMVFCQQFYTSAHKSTLIDIIHRIASLTLGDYRVLTGLLKLTTNGTVLFSKIKIICQSLNFDFHFKLNIILWRRPSSILERTITVSGDEIFQFSVQICFKIKII